MSAEISTGIVKTKLRQKYLTTINLKSSGRKLHLYEGIELVGGGE
jgi:hypothetical protein